jgi:DNA-binding IclR family transcriptional regulator
MTAWLDREDRQYAEALAVHGTTTRAYGRRNLIDLCQQGAKAVGAGTHDAVRFDVFNGDEAEFVREYMRANYPDVPFMTTQVAGHTERAKATPSTTDAA